MSEPLPKNLAIVQKKFSDLTLDVIASEEYDYLISTAEVARGFEVSPSDVRTLKLNHADELIEGKHFVNNVDVNHRGRPSTCWTKRGIVRLGFIIDSARARMFRDWAEDLVITHIEQGLYVPGSTLLINNLLEFGGNLANTSANILESVKLLVQHSEQMDKRLQSIEQKLHVIQSAPTLRVEVRAQVDNVIHQLQVFNYNMSIEKIRLRIWKVLHKKYSCSSFATMDQALYPEVIDYLSTVFKWMQKYQKSHPDFLPTSLLTLVPSQQKLEGNK